MKTIPEALLPRISKLIEVDERGIKEIVAIRNAGIPITIADAKNIIDSEYSSKEQKAQARTNLTELLRLDVALADNYKQARDAYQDIYAVIWKIDAEIILPAVKKFSAYANETYEITIYTRSHHDLSEEIRKEHDAVVRQELLKRANNFGLAVKIWHDFDFIDTPEGDMLIEMTRGFIEKAKSGSKKPLRFSFYNDMKMGHPLRMEALLYALECCNDEAELRKTHKIFLNELELAEKKSASEKIYKQEVIFLKSAIDEILKKLDFVCCESINSNTDEETLLNIRNKSTWPTLLPCTLEKCKQLLVKIWENKRTSSNITFDEALETFQKAIAFGLPDDDPLIAKYWMLLKHKTTGRDDYKKLVYATSRQKYCDDAIGAWVVWHATFDELVHYQKEKRSDSETLQSIIVEFANTFERAISLIEDTSDDEYEKKIAENLANQIPSFHEGLVILKMKLRPCQKTILTRGVFKHVTNESEFEIVMNFLGDQYSRTKEDHIILVEKALELFGEASPAEPASSPTT